jgi:hypothetical protein
MEKPPFTLKLVGSEDERPERESLADTASKPATPTERPKLKLVGGASEEHDERETGGIREYTPALPDRIATVLRAAQIQSFINSLKGAESSITVQAETQTLVSTYTENELKGWIADTTEADWKLRPAFFRTLCERYVKMVQEGMK